MAASKFTHSHSAALRITRRGLVKAAVGAGAVLALPTTKNRAEPVAADRAAWSIGCFNRPWSAFSYSDALDGMRAAGFTQIGILGDHAGEPFTAPDATNEYLDELRRRIEARKLSLEVAWLKADASQSVAEAVRVGRREIDHAHRLGAKIVLSMGADRPETYERYYHAMSELAAYAADRDMKVAVKPHGGCSATADDMLRTIEHVNRPNFRIWYDAGNIVHYTAADPVADVARVAELVIGFSAKDCAQRGGDVMLQFGEGKVDFRNVFQVLQGRGFRGPVFVECCRGSTLGELSENAAANRVFLEQLCAAL